MLINIAKNANLLEFREELLKEENIDVSKCYQCGKCTAGCPMNYLMDIPPSQVIRFCQLGLMEKVLNSRTIWYCVFCDTCSTRCPQDVDIKGVMDAFRRMAVKKGITEKARDVDTFQRAFSGSIYSFGRVYEPEMVVNFNLRSGKLFKDVNLFPLMLLKKKISLKPTPKRVSEVRKVYKKVNRIRKEKV
ncbi:MAG: 4Fe-4S dicluster domain-containing protein [Caldisericia bacterium]|jgi:heterodisulfide reductase subunit C|nr:4Fe-4S dicluster domain-containing protein [Caldisericia bacterium]MDD5689352.1 4Fe-4S dicluster domain-containing protein [Caldisericia bacterium]